MRRKTRLGLVGLLAVLVATAASAQDALRPDLLDSGEVAYGRGKPATSIKIVDTAALSPPNPSPWFLRGDVSLDVPVKGAEGFGASVGHLWKRVFLDLAFSYYSAHYGAVRVVQPGAPLDPNSQIGQARADTDTGNILTLGPGVGYMFNLFDSKNWVQTGRFGAGFVQYSDVTNSESFHGGLINLHAEAGYRLSSAVTIAPGMTYNVGFMTGPSPAVTPRPPGDPHDKFLPIQWWSWQLGLYVWL